jgi:small GTP-binding protein
VKQLKQHTEFFQAYFIPMSGVPQPAQPSDSARKVVLVGDSGVGKTSILLQLSEHLFRRITTPTVGSGCYVQSFKSSQGPVSLQIWDTAGEERYRSFTKLYSRGAEAAVIVFDVADELTFQAVTDWIAVVRDSAADSLLIYIVGNKIDLDERVVTLDQGTEFAQKHGFKYYDVSAATGENIEFVFTDIAEAIVHAGIVPKPAEVEIALEKKNPGCC